MSRLPASAGVSYKLYGFLLTTDGIWGSGYRRGFANTGVLPPILQFNAGIVRGLKFPALGEVECRVDMINVFNHPYQIRNGTGIGIFPPPMVHAARSMVASRWPLRFPWSLNSLRTSPFPARIG